VKLGDREVGKELDRNGFVVLDANECLRLTAQAQLGRLSVTSQALPMILPVAYGLIDGAPVFRVGPGVLRKAAERRAVSCFEVDAAHATWAWAWSVAMIGPLTLIDDPSVIDQALRLQLPAWAKPAGAAEFVRIEPAIVSGRWYGNVPSN
jgi:uncharacterized protein